MIRRGAALRGAQLLRLSDGGSIRPAALGALACAMAGASVAAAPGPGPAGAFGAALALSMLAIAVIDARRFLIPNGLSLAAFLLALANAAIAAAGWPDAPHVVGLSLLRAGVLGLAFLALREAYFRLRGREGIGLGDVKLAAVAGAWLDWPLMPLSVEIAALAGLGAYAFGRFAGRRPIRATARLPFGLFFAPAIWFCWLIQASILEL
jgi:leader peptidase (prepilin peptidase)/N-methyltransferase